MSWELELKKQGIFKPEQIQKLVTTSLQRLNDDITRIASKGVTVDLDNDGMVSNIEIQEVMSFMKSVKDIIAFLAKLEKK